MHIYVLEVLKVLEELEVPEVFEVPEVLEVLEVLEDAYHVLEAVKVLEVLPKVLEVEFEMLEGVHLCCSAFWELWRMASVCWSCWR